MSEPRELGDYYSRWRDAKAERNELQQRIDKALRYCEEFNNLHGLHYVQEILRGES